MDPTTYIVLELIWIIKFVVVVVVVVVVAKDSGTDFKFVNLTPHFHTVDMFIRYFAH